MITDISVKVDGIVSLKSRPIDSYIPMVYKTKKWLPLKLTWKGMLRKGEVIIEAESLEELISTLDKLEIVEPASHPKQEHPSTINSEQTPKMSGNLKPSQAVREALKSEWGLSAPRTMKEITSVLAANALYFSPSSLSGVLTNLVKKGELKRFKKNDQWAYTLGS